MPPMDNELYEGPDRRATNPMEEVLARVAEMTDEASGLRQDVQTLNEKAERDRTIIDGLSRTVKLLMAGLVLTAIIGVIVCVGVFYSVGASSNAAQSSSQLEDCLTPQGDCAKRLSQAGSLSDEIQVLQIENSRLTSQIEAAKASEAAGSPTANATGMAYMEQQKKVQAQIAVKTDQLRRVSPIPGLPGQ